MDNSLVLIFIAIASFVLGLLKFSNITDSASWELKHKFAEIWNCFANFFVTGLIGYFFVSVRLPQLLGNGVLNASDVFLLIFFLLGVFGHLNVLSFNITEGIKAIMDKYFKG